MTEHKSQQGLEEWIAEHGLQFVDTLGGYGVKLQRSSGQQYPCPEYVSVDDLLEFLSGMEIVPIEEKSGYAGATLWIGDMSVTRIFTKKQIDSDAAYGRLLTSAAQVCRDLLADANKDYKA